jgi:sulfur carrier protein
LKVIANGATIELPASATLSDLLSVLGLGATWVVAERNGEAIARAAMATTVLAEGDRIELVGAVAGG